MASNFRNLHAYLSYPHPLLLASFIYLQIYLAFVTLVCLQDYHGVGPIIVSYPDCCCSAAFSLISLLPLLALARTHTHSHTHTHAHPILQTGAQTIIVRYKSNCFSSFPLLLK